jgi:hypothetical protein
MTAIEQIQGLLRIDSNALSLRLWSKYAVSHHATIIDSLSSLEGITADALEATDAPTRSFVKCALYDAPFDKVYDTLGRDVSVYVLLSIVEMRKAEAFRKKLSARTGMSAEHLEIARMSQLHRSKTKETTVSGVLSSYKLIDRIDSGQFLAEIDLKQGLQAVRTTDVPLDAKRLADYSYIPFSAERFMHDGAHVVDWSTNQINNVEYSLWIDAPVAVALCYKGYPQALIGVNHYDADTLMIYQIQGVNGYIVDEEGKYIKNPETGKFKKKKCRGLAVLDWQTLLVEHVAVSLAQELGYKKIGIQGGRNNFWTGIYRDGTIHLPVERALHIYDALAERLGFQKKDDGNWYREMK